MNEQDLLREFSRYSKAPVYPFVIDTKKCEGMYLVTVDGRRILDWTCQFASKLIAYNHPRLYEPEYVAQLVSAANNKLANPNNLSVELIEYYRLLHRLTPKCMSGHDVEVYSLNSGAEAVENAMKYMIALYHERSPERMVPRPSDTPCFITFDGGFHGRTVYTLNATHMPHNEAVTRDYHGLTVKNVRVPFPTTDRDLTFVAECLEKLETALVTNGQSVAGIIIEPMQGAGGHRVAHHEFFCGISNLAHKFEVPVCFDEVQTAGGQTGTVFMCDQFDLPHPPHVVVSAKKFACGTLHMLKTMKERHVLDSTWSGTLADMVRFVQEWKVVESEGLIGLVPQKTALLTERLVGLTTKHPTLMWYVRGSGLYQGFSVPEHLRNKIVKEALDLEDLLLMPAGSDTIRLRPNLNVTEDDVERLIDRLDRTFARQ